MDISVVIGFRDWGLERIRIATTSIQNSFGDWSGEVIISDYGSINPEENEALARELGAKYVYTEGDPNWSRARALNAGFAVAEGTFLVSTDADMVFSPRSFDRICEIAHYDSHSAYFLQCRDLPPHMDHEYVQLNPNSWEEYEKEGRLRPRWGMGGMMAISREGFNAINGFDERLHTWGGEDLDFAQRARRAGYRTFWIDDPEVRMYHMWHPPSRQLAEQSEEGRSAVEFNRNIVYTDPTYLRNFEVPQRNSAQRPPLVTVAISTLNRSGYLRETLQSVLAQSVQDFEIVIVDDGGSDDTQSMVESFGDPRIRYFWQENKGISAARNFALAQSKGQFTAVIDDDDLMHPLRLQWHLEALQPGEAGNCGSFVNFDDLTGVTELIVSMVPTVATAADKGSAPGHGTWFIATDVLSKFKYDESITSSVDNNLMLRMLRAGIEIGHTGKPVTLRRMHPGQVTVTDADRQKGAAVDVLQFFKWNLTSYNMKKLEEDKKQKTWPAVDDRVEMLNELQPYLPDHLVKRTISFSTFGDLEFKDWQGDLSITSLVVDGEVRKSTGTIFDASYQDIVNARKLNLQFQAEANTLEETPVKQGDLPTADWISDVIDACGFETESRLPFVFIPEHDHGVEGSVEVSVISNKVRHDWTVVNLSSEEAADVLNFVPHSFTVGHPDLGETL